MTNPNKRSVIVVGNNGCGKTRHAEALRAHFGLDHIVDDWNDRRDVPRYNTLVLTSYMPTRAGSCEVVKYDDVIALALAR